MKCPFELPVRIEESIGMGYIIKDKNNYFVQGHRNRIQANYIVQAINSHEKLVSVLMLSQSILGSHITYHIKNNTQLCENCITNIKDAVLRIQQALKEVEKA